MNQYFHSKTLPNLHENNLCKSSNYYHQRSYQDQIFVSGWKILPYHRKSRPNKLKRDQNLNLPISILLVQLNFSYRDMFSIKNTVFIRFLIFAEYFKIVLTRIFPIIFHVVNSWVVKVEIFSHKFNVFLKEF